MADLLLRIDGCLFALAACGLCLAFVFKEDKAVKPLMLIMVMTAYGMFLYMVWS